MSQYWVANNPGSTVTSSQAEALAVMARGSTSTGVAAAGAAFDKGLESTGVANILAAAATKLNGLSSQISTVAKAQNLGKIASTTAGAVDVKQINWSSSVADPTHLINVLISPTSRVLVTTAVATANGVVCGGGSTDTKGQIKIQVLTSTGGAVNRYILLYSS